MNKQHYKLRSILLISALFLSAFTFAFGNIYISFGQERKSEVLGLDTSTEKKELEISSTISNIIENDNIIQATYTFTAKNNTTKPISEISFLANFESTFPDNEFSIIGISSEHEYNPSFNGLNNKQLFTKLFELEPGNVSSVTATIEFDPKGFEGPFENSISASGVYDGEVIETEVKSETKDNNQNNTDTTKKPEDTKKDDVKKAEDTKPKPPVEKPKETNFDDRKITAYLVDVVTKQDLMEITSDSILDFDELANPITIRIDVNPPTIGSLLIGLNGNKKYRVEGALPYAIVHNSKTHYDAWYPAPGEQTLSLTVFSEQGAKGEEIGFKEINFTIIGTAPVPVVEEVKNETKKDTAIVVTESSAVSAFSITLNKISEILDEEVVEEEIIVGEDGNIETVEVVKSSSSSNNGISGVSIFDETIRTGMISGVSTSKQVNDISINNPFEEDSSEGLVQGISISKGVDTEGRVLAATGINISQTLLIGIIIMIAVVELYAFKAEKRFLTSVINKS